MKDNNIRQAHIIGIEGAGTSALARLLKADGIEVSGSDEGDHFYRDQLEMAGIRPASSFSAGNIPPQADLIIYSTAYKPETNQELAAAMETPAKVLSYPEALGRLFNRKYGIAVCGTHGKTTTTAWLGYVLEKAGLRPSVLVGSKVPQFGGNVLSGRSDYFVAETDEYQDKLKYYRPRGVLLNNIDYDHPDFFPDEDSYIQAFARFVRKIPARGFLVANFDDDRVRRIAAAECRGRVIGYGLQQTADYAAYGLSAAAGRQYFKVKLGAEAGEDSGDFADTDLGEFAVSLPGRHNVSNALAVIAAAAELGVELNVIRTELENFAGTARRLEEMGRYRGAPVIDDYAHHPAEIRASLEGVRQKYPGRRLIAVFQPHTFTRTKALLGAFAASFGGADEVIVLDIYGSAREQQGGVSAQDLVERLKANDSRLKVCHLSGVKECAAYLRGRIAQNDVVVLMGAGDVYEAGLALLK